MPIVNSLTVHTGTYLNVGHAIMQNALTCAPTTMTTLRHAWDRTVYNAYMFYVTSTDCHAGLCMYDDSFTGYACYHVTPARGGYVSHCRVTRATVSSGRRQIGRSESAAEIRNDNTQSRRLSMLTSWRLSAS